MADVDFDDDAPPDLVDIAADQQLEEITVKVPITIVTGEEMLFIRFRIPFRF